MAPLVGLAPPAVPTADARRGASCQDAGVNEFLTSSLLLLPVAAVAVAVLHTLLMRIRRRRRQRRERGGQLIHELKAYSAWVDSLRGEPPLTSEPEELTPAQALRDARAIAQAHFPQLGQSMLRLLRADSELMRHLWKQKLLRLSEPAVWVPYDRDPVYCGLRDAQEDLIDAIIARCQALTGDRGPRWHNTRLDPEFFTSMGMTSSPSR